LCLAAQHTLARSSHCCRRKWCRRSPSSKAEGHAAEGCTAQGRATEGQAAVLAASHAAGHAAAWASRREDEGGVALVAPKEARQTVSATENGAEDALRLLRGHAPAARSVGAPRAARTLLAWAEGGFAELVIRLALLGVPQYVVGLSDSLEVLRRTLLVIGVLVRVVFQGELPVRPRDLGVRRAPVDTEDAVVAARTKVCGRGRHAAFPPSLARSGATRCKV